METEILVMIDRLREMEKKLNETEEHDKNHPIPINIEEDYQYYHNHTLEMVQEIKRVWNGY